ncbi:hypothetical protein DRQ33_07220, partial [bacterium]
QIISYQGKLTDSKSGVAMNGAYDITFRIYSSENDISALWSETHRDVLVKNGLFSVMLGTISPFAPALDFSQQYYLEVEVDGNVLTPRFRLGASPYALGIPGFGARDGQVLKWSEESGKWLPADDEISSDIEENQPKSAILEQGDCIHWIRDTDGGRVIYTGDWEGDGSCEQDMLGISRGDSDNELYGSEDSTHVNLGVSCTTGTSGQNYSYCVVSGGWKNLAAYDGSAVVGGEDNKVYGKNSIIGAGLLSKIDGSHYSAIAGGERNKIFGTGDSCSAALSSYDIEEILADPEIDESMKEGLRLLSTLGGDTAGFYSFIGAGYQNKICQSNNGIVSGANNEINANSGFIGSGSSNQISSSYGFIGGGYANRITNSYGAVVNGSNNYANGTGSFVGNGTNNTSDSYYSFIGAGRYNDADGHSSFIGGGTYNYTRDSHSIVVGGMSNDALGTFSFIGGGRDNVCNAYFTTISGGGYNYASGYMSTIGGGYADTVLGDYGGIFSGDSNKVGDAATDTASVILGGKNNKVLEKYSSILGGKGNIVSSNYSLAFGNGVNIVNDYNTVFYNSSNPGKVGININNPSQELEVVGGAKIDGSTFFVDDVNHRVGIGTNSPDYSLHVEGNISFPNYLAYFKNDANDAIAVYAECANLDGWGTGGYFKGGKKGITTVVTPTGNSNYYGIYSSVGRLSGPLGHNYGVYSLASDGNDNYGVFATAEFGDNNTGVIGYAENGASTNCGVLGRAYFSGPVSPVYTYGLFGIGDGGGSATTGYGVYATLSSSSTNDFAGYFNGNVHITGTLSKGAGSFLIDDPLDPLNKVLRHNFVESPENLCLYRGKIKLDSTGVFIVKMPKYFKALTKEDEATVQLTPIDGFCELWYKWNEDYSLFEIHGSPNFEVSYLVLADRDDPVIHKLARPVEEIKDENNPWKKGKLLYPEAYGYPKEMGQNWEQEQEMIRQIKKNKHQ